MEDRFDRRSEMRGQEQVPLQGEQVGAVRAQLVQIRSIVYRHPFTRNNVHAVAVAGVGECAVFQAGC